MLENYGKGVYGPYYNAGAPVAGTNAVETLTLAGTVAPDTFRLSLDGINTAAITWNATNATLLADIQAKLDAAFGASQIVATAGTLTAGVGTVLLTFSGSNYSGRVVNAMTATRLTGTALTISVAITTPGVNATYRDAAMGATIVDVSTGIHYQKTGAAGTGTYVKTGLQS